MQIDFLFYTSPSLPKKICSEEEEIGGLTPNPGLLPEKLGLHNKTAFFS
jgi:hypothetical protein